MPLSICPSLFHIVPDARTSPYGPDDIFYSDGFKVLQAESLTRIKDIVSQLSTDQHLHVRLLCCYRAKGLSETYCTFRQVDNPEKEICSKESGIETSFIHFHIHGKMNSLRCSEYLLAFIEDSDLSNNVETLAEELLSSIAWLEIDAPAVFLNVFTFGQPVYGTRNLDYSLEKLKSSVKTQAGSKYHGTVEIRISHINKESENRLSVSLKSGYLFFNPS